jgi:hypothetical protein
MAVYIAPTSKVIDIGSDGGSLSSQNKKQVNPIENKSIMIYGFIGF